MPMTPPSAKRPPDHAAANESLVPAMLRVSREGVLIGIEDHLGNNLGLPVTTQSSAQGIASFSATPQKHPAMAVTNMGGLKTWFAKLSDFEAGLVDHVNVLSSGCSVYESSWAAGSFDATLSLVETGRSFMGVFGRLINAQFGCQETGFLSGRSDQVVWSGGTSVLTGGPMSTGAGANNGRVMNAAGCIGTFSVPKSTTLWIHHLRGTGFGAFSYAIDGGAPVTVNCESPTNPLYDSVKISGLSNTTHTVVITTTTVTASGPLLMGIAYAGDRGIVVMQLPRESYGLQDALGKGYTNTGVTTSGYHRCLQGWAMGSPALVVGPGFERNDAVGYALKAFTIDEMRVHWGYIRDYVCGTDPADPKGSLFMVDETADYNIDDPTAWGAVSLMDVYNARDKFALENLTCVAHLYTRKVMGGPAEMASNRFYRSGNPQIPTSNDVIHPSVRGQAAWGRAMFEILKPGYVFAV